ncbi:MAG: hypothetical protein ACLFP2_04100 [Candidatus Woesearchaeota archaeon]
MKYVLINGTEDEREKILKRIHTLEYDRQQPYRQQGRFPEQTIYTIGNTSRYNGSLEEELKLQEKWEREVPEFITDIVMDESCAEKVMKAMVQGRNINGYKHYLEMCGDYALSIGNASPAMKTLQEKVYKNNNVQVLDLSDVEAKAHYIMEMILADQESCQAPQEESHTVTSHQIAMR